MNIKYLGIILICLGASDLLLWVINGFSFGWLEFVVGVNPISKFGGWGLIVLGGWLYQKEIAKEKSEIDLITDLEADEQLLHKQVSNSTIILITNKKVIFRNFGIEEKFAKEHNDVVVDEKISFPYSEIKTAKPIKYKETGKSSISRALNLEFGIQLVLQDGSIKNLVTSKSELLCAYILKCLSK